MKESEAKAISIELWTKMRDSVGTKKKASLDAEIWNKIKTLQNNCAACELFMNMNPDGTTYECDGCPINEAGEKCYGPEKTDLYYRFRTTHDEAERVETCNAAIAIFEAWETTD